MSTSDLDLASAIITRQFDLADGGHVDVFLWPPDCPGDDYPTCTYLIRGLGEDRVRKGQGVDSMDAVMSALKLIATELYYSQPYKDGELTWLGTRDLHLPMHGGEGPPQEENETADLLTLVSDCSVLAMPGSRFPYVAWPGERLQRVILRLKTLGEAARDIPELKGKLEALMADFTTYQEYYERVCDSKGFDIAYIKEERGRPSNSGTG